MPIDHLRVYASNSGDDANDGSSGSPVRSVLRGLQIAHEQGYSRTGALMLDAGFEDAQASLSEIWAIPGGVPGSLPFAIIGGFRDDADWPVKYATGAAAGDAGPPVTWASASFPSDAQYADDAAAGLFVKFDNGPYDSEIVVAHSSATGISVLNPGVAPATGNFRLRRPNASIANATKVTVVPGSGRALVMYGVDLAIDGSARVLVGLGAAVQLVGCRAGGDIELGDAALVLGAGLPSGAACGVEAELLNDARAAYELPPTGCWLASGVEVGGRAALSAARSNVHITQVYGAADLTDSQVGFGGLLASDRGAVYITQSRADAAMGAIRGSSITIIDVTASHGGSHGLHVDGATAYVASMQGTLTYAHAYGIYADHGARVTVVDPNGDTTISGPSGQAVRLGVAGKKSWAQIDAGAPADVLETTGVAPSATSVSE